MAERGLLPWLIQKAANGAWSAATPFVALSDWLDEAAFRAEKRRHR